MVFRSQFFNLKMILKKDHKLEYKKRKGDNYQFNVSKLLTSFRLVQPVARRPSKICGQELKSPATLQKQFYTKLVRKELALKIHTNMISVKNAIWCKKLIVEDRSFCKLTTNTRGLWYKVQMFVVLEKGFSVVFPSWEIVAWLVVQRIFSQWCTLHQRISINERIYRNSLTCKSTSLLMFCSSAGMI